MHINRLQIDASATDMRHKVNELVDVVNLLSERDGEREHIDVGLDPCQEVVLNIDG